MVESIVINIIRERFEEELNIDYSKNFINQINKVRSHDYKSYGELNDEYCDCNFIVETRCEYIIMYNYIKKTVNKLKRKAIKKLMNGWKKEVMRLSPLYYDLMNIVISYI